MKDIQSDYKKVINSQSKKFYSNYYKQFPSMKKKTAPPTSIKRWKKKRTKSYIVENWKDQVLSGASNNSIDHSVESEEITGYTEKSFKILEKQLNAEQTPQEAYEELLRSKKTNVN